MDSLELDTVQLNTGGREKKNKIVFIGYRVT